MKLNWFEAHTAEDVTPENRADKLPRIIERLNDKYGAFDYTSDARALDTEDKFGHTLKMLHAKMGLTPNPQKPTALIAGANNGYEINFFQDFDITALDLSDTALSALVRKHHQVHICQGDLQQLPFADKSFDVYVSMRSIHSTNVDIAQALQESLRVTKKYLIYSVSNAYNIDETLVKGMYDRKTQTISAEPVRAYVHIIEVFLNTHQCTYQIFEVPSEIIIFAKI